MQRSFNSFDYGKNIKCIGYNRKYVISLPDEVNATQTSQLMYRRAKFQFPNFNENAFGYIQGTMDSTMNGLKKFAEDVEWKVTKEEEEDIFTAFTSCFPELKGKFRVKSDLDVLQELTLGTSAGQPWMSLGCKKKLDALMQYYHLIFALAKSKNWTPLFKGSGKEERIKMKKILNRDVRLFISAPIEFIVKGMWLFSDISQYTVSHADDIDMPMKIGMMMVDGSLLGFFNNLDSTVWKVASDVNKWDGHFLNQLFDLIGRIKIWMHDPNDPLITVDEYKAQVEHYYKKIKKPNICMPDGNVYQVKMGQMSGVYTTGQDNSLGHTLINFLGGIRKHGLTEFISRYKRKEYIFGVVGDDNCSGLPVEWNFEFRKKLYADFGMILKEEDDFCSQDSNGITFLSFKFDKINNSILFNRDKLLCSLVHEPDPKTQQQKEVYVNRIGMLALLAAFDVDLCQFIIQQYRNMREKYKTKLPPPYELEVKALQALWRGGEMGIQVERFNILISSLIH